MTRSVAIIGAGLAGAACANAFALAGFQVTVFEQGATPAAGASGVPLAMFAPSVSSDDAPHSRLLRSGVHVLLEELNGLSASGHLTQGVDWAMTGVQERCIRGDKKLPSTWLEPLDPPALQSRVLAKPMRERLVGDSTPVIQSLFHGAAGWVVPQRLIAAWLSHPNITVEMNAQVANLADARFASKDVIVVACGYEVHQLLPKLETRLQPIRGQVEWGRVAHWSINPINGMGHWIEGAGKWLAGATFQRDDSSLEPRAKDTQLNFEKLNVLRPEMNPLHIEQLRATSQPWVGVRTAQKTRAPLIEQMHDTVHPHVWVCAGLGSRGLSLAAQNARTLLQEVLRSSH